MFLLFLKIFLVLYSLLYNKLENMFLLTPSHVPVSRFALRSYVLARTRITIYEINWDHKLAPTTSSFFLGGVNIIAKNYLANSAEYFHKPIGLINFAQQFNARALLKQNINSYIDKYI